MNSNERTKVLLATMLAASFGFGATVGELEKGFANPPDSAKPHTWWHWMNGNISKEGITADLVEKTMTTVEEAKAQGAMALFGSKYGEQVSMYTIGDFSKEICGGPHVANTSELGGFKILKEQSSSAGVRRIKAVVTNLS